MFIGKKLEKFGRNSKSKFHHFDATPSGSKKMSEFVEEYNYKKDTESQKKTEEDNHMRSGEE